MKRKNIVCKTKKPAFSSADCLVSYLKLLLCPQIHCPSISQIKGMRHISTFQNPNIRSQEINTCTKNQMIISQELLKRRHLKESTPKVNGTNSYLRETHGLWPKLTEKESTDAKSLLILKENIECKTMQQVLIPHHESPTLQNHSNTFYTKSKPYVKHSYPWKWVESPSAIPTKVNFLGNALPASIIIR